MEILDSGTRRNFDSGAVRDVGENKGRADLLPLDVVETLLFGEEDGLSILPLISDYIYNGDTEKLYTVISRFVYHNWGVDKITAILEVSKHYEEGAKKYDERNWEKGIPLHCYIDSGIRHYLKFMRGDEDEPHGRAFIWNMLGAIWTQKHKPELIDLPFGEGENAKTN